MPMDSTVLAASMKQKMDAVADSYKDGSKGNEDTLNALAEAIIEHIETYAMAGPYPVT